MHRPKNRPPRAPRLTRVCPRCGREQPIPEFYLHRATGRRASHCRACCRAYRRRYYAAHPERVKAAVLASRRREDPARRRARNRRYARRARQRRAQAAVRERTRRLRILGLLTLADHCQDCGRTPQVVHHETYGDVLALVSLCRSCHMKRHFRIWRKTGGGPVRYPWEYDREVDA